MPVESDYVVRGVDKCCGFCSKWTLKWRLVVEENGRLRKLFHYCFFTKAWMEKIVKIPNFSDFSNFLSIWACLHVCNVLIFNFKTKNVILANPNLVQYWLDRNIFCGEDNSAIFSLHSNLNGIPQPEVNMTGTLQFASWTVVRVNSFRRGATKSTNVITRKSH